MASTLTKLVDIIQDGVKKINDAHAQAGVSVSTLDQSINNPGDTLPPNEEVMKTTALVVSAAYQLIANILPPSLYVLEAATAYNQVGALGAIEALNIAEIIRENDKGSGVHADDIAKKAKQDPTKIARLLRFLATHYIFREVSPNVFAHNRNSSVIDTGKSLEEIQGSPLEKYTNSNGVAALIGHCTDEVAKSSAYLTETLLDPNTALSFEPNLSALSRAMNTKKSFFEFLEEPGQEFRFKRFGLAMRGGSEHSKGVLKGFDWGALAKGSVIVDVGGGVGNVTRILANAFPDLKFVIQDRSAVIEDGIKVWQAEEPDALSSGRVTFQAQNFFEPQPSGNTPPALFYLQSILHDWPRSYCLTILKHLRAAAGSNTKLLVADMVLGYACPPEPEVNSTIGIPGAVLPPAPEPLLPNLGRGGATAYMLDYQMLVGVNAQERTVDEFMELGTATGWKLTSITRAGLRGYVLFTPA